MPKPDFRRLEELFHQAAALDPAQRPEFLKAACAGDTELHAAVEELLRHDQDGSGEPIRSPVATRVEQLRLLSPTHLVVVEDRPVPALVTFPSIAGYELLEQLGRGGMGVVYKARQISLNRIVALKMLLPNAPVEPEHLVRFRSEAEALAKLHHPNIITIYEIAESEGRPYFTMQYVPGPSLAEVSNGHPQDVAAAARLVEVTARAVQAIHECGIIHRDLKPGNILLWLDRRSATDGDNASPESSLVMNAVPKITDFGLAKDLAGGGNLTTLGAAMGTPSYMAPEQARGDIEIGPGTDIYALGAILYEMLTGRPPFGAGNLAETFGQLQKEEPLSPFRLRPNLPRDVVTICMKCLEKSPRNRYSSALELAEDLRRFHSGEPIHARPVGLLERTYRWCRRRPLVTGLTALSALLALTCVVTVIVYQIRLNAALTREVSREAGQIAQQSQLISQLHVKIGVTLIEAGDNFAAVFHFTEALKTDEGTEREHLHRTRIGIALRQCPRLIDVVAHEGTVLCAGNDRVVTSSDGRTLDVTQMRGGQPIISVPMPPNQIQQCTLSPDGRFLGLISEKGSVTIWDLAKSEAHELASSSPGRVQRLIFHPGGGILLVPHSMGQLEVWDLATWKELPSTSLSTDSVYSMLSDDGRWLFTLDADHRCRVWDSATGKLLGQPLNLGHEIRAASVGSDGRLLAVVSKQNELSIWDLSTNSRIGKQTNLLHDVSRVAISPDGERIATLCRDGSLQFRRSQNGEVLAEISAPIDATGSLTFSADSRFLLTIGDPGDVRVWDSVTGQAATPWMRHGGRLVFAAFRNNGEELITVSKSGLMCLWELPRRPGLQRGMPAEVGLKQVGNERVIALANGITARTNGAAEGALTPPHRETRIAENAILSPDGSNIAVCEDAKTVLIAKVDGGEIVAALHHLNPVLYAAFSPNGKRLLTACADRSVRLWDVANGELLSPPIAHSLAIERVFFHEGDSRAGVVHKGDRASIWNLEEDNHAVKDLVVLAELLAGGHNDPNSKSPPSDSKSILAKWEKLSLVE